MKMAAHHNEHNHPGGEVPLGLLLWGTHKERKMSMKKMAEGVQCHADLNEAWRLFSQALPAFDIQPEDADADGAFILRVSSNISGHFVFVAFVRFNDGEASLASGIAECKDGHADPSKHYDCEVETYRSVNDMSMPVCARYIVVKMANAWAELLMIAGLNYDDAIRIARRKLGLDVPKVKLYIRIESGCLESIESDKPSHFDDVDVIKVDFDTAGAVDDVAMVSFSTDGDDAKPAYSGGMLVEGTNIDSVEDVVYTSEAGNMYTTPDFLELAQGNERLASAILDLCEWESPSAVLEQLIANASSHELEDPELYEAIMAVAG